VFGIHFAATCLRALKTGAPAIRRAQRTDAVGRAIGLQSVSAQHALVLLLAAALTSGGCQWEERHASIEEITAIDGVSACEFDGLNVRIEGMADASGLLLVSNGRIVEQVELRVGDGFVITDGRSLHTAYQLLKAGPERITFKQTEFIDRRAAREGIRTAERVIAIEPYDPEADGRRPTARE